MFNESEWIRMVFLLADTQAWVDDIFKNTMQMLPVGKQQNLFRKTYYLTPGSLAHILERHYYRLSRFPGSGKFTIPVQDIVHWIREAYSRPSLPLENSINALRSFDTCVPLGFDRQGLPTTIINIITSPNGRVVTAFPGAFRCSQLTGIAS